MVAGGPVARGITVAQIEPEGAVRTQDTPYGAGYLHEMPDIEFGGGLLTQAAPPGAA